MTKAPQIKPIKILLRESAARLKSSSETAALDAELLLMHVLGKNRAFLYAHGDQMLSTGQALAFEHLILERIKGMPIAYLLETREFWSHALDVTPDTLIPRPETEMLVLKALEFLGSEPTCAVLELGTGTGAISIALASERPGWEFLALDKSPKALLVAKRNAQKYQIKNICFIESNWFEQVQNFQFDLIVSNPPYLAVNDPHQYQGDLRFEPQSALLSGLEGLDDLTQIIQDGMQYLKPGGLLLLEHGCTQGASVRELLAQHRYVRPTTWKDSNQLDRVTAGFAPG